MITRVACVIRPKGSDLIFDHPYNAESVCPRDCGVGPGTKRRMSSSDASEITERPCVSVKRDGKNVEHWSDLTKFLHRLAEAVHEIGIE